MEKKKTFNHLAYIDLVIKNDPVKKEKYLFVFTEGFNSITTKMIQENLIGISLLLRISKRITMTGNNNVYKTIWKNGNKEYNEKYICCFLTI